MANKLGPVLNTPVVKFFLNELARRGHDVGELVVRFGLDPSIAMHTLALKGASAFFESCAAVANDELFGFRVAQALPRGSYGLIEFLWRNAPTLGTGYEALRRFRRYVSEVFEPSWRETAAGRGRLVYAVPPAPLTLGRQAHEFIVSETVFILGQLSAGAFRARGVGFAHAPGPYADVLAHALGTAVSYHQPDNWIELDREELARPISGADHALYVVLEGHLADEKERLARPSSILEQVEQAIVMRLASGSAELRELALVLRVSERTLQRRVEAEGTSVRALVERVRYRRALVLLNDPSIPLGEVARRLGFSEYSAFGRAFRRWANRSPASVRRRLQARR